MTKNDNEHLGQIPAPEKAAGTGTHFPEGLRVLAVDDNIVCLKLLARLLQKCLYEVSMITNASQALEVLRNNKDKYDIVITDIKMPDMDGFELLEIIGLEMDIPVIMMSANDNRDWMMKGLEHGARDYLLKPVRMEELKIIWKHVIMKYQIDPKKSNLIKGEEMDQNNSIPLKRQRDKGKEKEDEMNTEINGKDCPQKKRRMVWTSQLHRKFFSVVKQLGANKAVPKRILQLMNEPDLTREHIASHLQKYRDFLKKDQRNAISNCQESNTNVNSDITYEEQLPRTNATNVASYKQVQSSSINHLSTNSQIIQINPRPLFLPPNPHETILSRSPIPPQGFDQMWPSEMHVPANHSRRPTVNDYVEISSHVPSFTQYPRAFNVTFQPNNHSLLGPVPIFSAVQFDHERNMVMFNGGGSLNFRGEINRFPFDVLRINVDNNSTGNGQTMFVQPPQESIDRESTFHHIGSSYNSIDDELNIMLNQFGNSAAPKL